MIRAPRRATYMFFWNSRRRKEAAQRQLLDAVTAFDSDTARRLLEKGVDVNARFDVEGGGVVTVLHYACGLMEYRHGASEKLVELFIEHGADPNAVDPASGNTPFHYTTTGEWGLAEFDTMKILLKHGADPNVANKEGRTPYSQAYGGWRAINMLFERYDVRDNEESLAKKAKIAFTDTIDPQDDLRIPKKWVEGKEAEDVKGDIMSVLHSVWSKMDDDIAAANFNRGQRMLFYVNWLNGDVGNGGFDQYFTHSPLNFALQALDGLDLLNCPEHKALLTKAMEQFPGEYPVDWSDSALDMIEDDSPIRAVWNDLDLKYYKLPDLYGLMSEYVDSHRTEFVRD